MKLEKVLDVMTAIYHWHSEDGEIGEISRLLGDDTAEVSNMLLLNGCCDSRYKPANGLSYQAVVNIILLYVAMRQGFTRKGKR